MSDNNSLVAYSLCAMCMLGFYLKNYDQAMIL